VLYYFDSSALVKISLPEPERPALLQWLPSNPSKHATSALALTEVERAIRKNASASDLQKSLAEMAATFSRIVLIGVSNQILRGAAALTPLALRSLDAIHLASALELRPDLDGLVTYDTRMAEAARFHGINVIQPS